MIRCCPARFPDIPIGTNRRPKVTSTSASREFLIAHSSLTVRAVGACPRGGCLTAPKGMPLSRERSSQDSRWAQNTIGPLQRPVKRGPWISGRHEFTDGQDAEPKLREWQRRYNHERFFLALAGQTPAEKLAATPSSGEAHLMAIPARTVRGVASETMIECGVRS